MYLIFKEAISEKTLRINDTYCQTKVCKILSNNNFSTLREAETLKANRMLKSTERGKWGRGEGGEKESPNL